MTSAKTPQRQSLSKIIVPAILIAAAALTAIYALTHHVVIKKFQNPIAYTMVDDQLYLIEKENNTLLQLAYSSPTEPLKEIARYQIEPDDEKYYYMVRHLYPGPQGLVVLSQFYDRATKTSVGHRAREYTSLLAPPREIFKIYYKDPLVYPWIRYTFDQQGNHYFVNESADQYNIWKLPPKGEITMRRGKVPPEITELGQKNKTLANWNGICIGPENQIFALNGQTGQVVEYSPEGEKIREFGREGFTEGELLAPSGLFFLRLAPDDVAALTVNSAGNRTWIQFTPDGQVIRAIVPLKSGYQFFDILIDRIYTHHRTQDQCSFDLVNKCLVVLNKNFAPVAVYQTTQPAQTILLLAIALLLLLAGIFYHKLASFFKRWRFPFFLKLILLFVPLLVISALVVGDWVKDVMKADLETESLRRSANLAQAIVNNITLKDLEKIHQPADRKSDTYEKIHSTASKIVDTKNVEFTPKWIIHKIRDGRFYFGINIWRGPIYEPFIVPQEREMFHKVLQEKTPQYGRFRDEQGEWFSYLYPILNKAGAVSYVVELYRPTEELDRIDKEVNRQVKRIIAVTVLAAVLLILIFSYLFTRPLRRLTQATKVISRGDFERQITIHSRDEMEDLGQAFNQMTVNLKKYIHDLARATAEKERMQSELRLAREIQQGILPKTFPPFDKAENVEIFARIEPATEVGGDYYDFFIIDENHIGVAVADVCGHGVPAGLYMMNIRALLRSAARNNLSAADTITQLNKLIVPDTPSRMFVTMLYLVCNMKTGQITFCNAGHHPPLLLQQGQTKILSAEQGQGEGTIVGSFMSAQYSDGKLVLAPGESLIIYTDGIIECYNKNKEMYGTERLMEAVTKNAHLPNKEIANQVFQEIAQFHAGSAPADDITILFLKFLGMDKQKKEKEIAP